MRESPAAEAGRVGVLAEARGEGGCNRPCFACADPTWSGAGTQPSRHYAAGSGDGSTAQHNPMTVLLP